VCVTNKAEEVRSQQSEREGRGTNVVKKLNMKKIHTEICSPSLPPGQFLKQAFPASSGIFSSKLGLSSKDS